MENWVEVQIETHSDAAEIVAAALAPMTGGVELRDAGTLLSAGPDRTCVVSLCQPDQTQAILDAVADVLATARAAGLAVDPVVVRQRNAHEDEWRDIWKQFFLTTRVGRRFTVQPSWDVGAVPVGEFIIHLDPGMAFGTGAHPSTRLVIGLAEEFRETRTDLAKVLDLGSGSGILSIVAARLWPQAAGLAVDIDPQATVCAQENLDRNQVTCFEVRTGTLADVPGKFDLIMANIQADVLGELAPLLWPRLAEDGRLILSGILLEQIDPLIEIFRAAGFALDARAAEGEWGGLRLRSA
ncbi:MAG TPA: 50S ribosomal protein L11 methyltransferase [Polyangia bacterium]